jgi:hypothetical protein
LINVNEADPVKAIRDLTHGDVYYAIDAIGLPRTQEQFLQATKMGFPGFSSRRHGFAYRHHPARFQSDPG